jgi:murein DD-endopeptidase MepM/ murein hydrolase activator NlpD
MALFLAACLHSPVPPSPDRPPRPSGFGLRLAAVSPRYPVVAVLLIALAIGVTGVLAGSLSSPLTVAPADPSAAALPTPPTGGADIHPSTEPSASPSDPPSSAAPGASPAASVAPPSPTATPETRSDPPEKLKGYVWPLRGARLTSRFGPRADGFVVVDGQRMHDGMDLATFCGDKIRAAHDGVVLYAGRKFDPYLGYSDSLDRLYARITNMNNFPVVVVIDDGNGYRSVYVHLSASGLKVGAGDVVKAGQVIGLEGATGRATGCHLHYSLIRMDGPWQDVSPAHQSLYPPRVRERVDPFLVLSLGHPDAPARVRERYFRTNPTPRPQRPIVSN